MSPELAAAAIDWMAERMVALARPSLEVHFFGGEPTRTPDLLELSVYRANMAAAEHGLRPHLEISTNGLMDDTMCGFLGDHFAAVVLSLDGPEEIQNSLRPTRSGRGSHARVSRSAQILGDAPAELCLRVCVTDGTVERMEEIARQLCESYSPAVIDFETVQCTPEPASSPVSAPDPYEFAIQCVRTMGAVRALGVTPVYAAAVLDRPRLTGCPLGDDTLLVSPGGRVSACYLPEPHWRQRGMELNLGRLDPAAGMILDEDAVEHVRQLVARKPPRCRRCFARWSCAGGCHVDHSHPGVDQGYGGYCTQTRIITAALLLEGMGCQELLQELLADRQALRDLAQHPDDTLRLPEPGRG